MMTTSTAVYAIQTVITGMRTLSVCIDTPRRDCHYGMYTHVEKSALSRFAPIKRSPNAGVILCQTLNIKPTFSQHLLLIRLCHLPTHDTTKASSSNRVYPGNQVTAYFSRKIRLFQGRFFNKNNSRQ